MRPIPVNLTTFRTTITENPGCSVLIEIAPSVAVAPHFHVTEIGRVVKEFVDCGGKPRSETRCLLQTLVAGDVDHRLDSTKLAGILKLADRLELTGEEPVEIEHQERSISTDDVRSITRDGDTLVIRLEPKQTACLAEDACGIPGLKVLQADACSLPICDSDKGCC